ncbi:GDSL esterase/lipase At4g16230 isoform X1 [Elaeis guineensis]|uniref:GDSL esterase/lipase At4g16230 isoform X1 n=1 Tax=Elaeis guineensis var. tenera TaxID=51953 RepID=A0A6I9RZQ5_ELAGV|nr:GDSL esterase/lipase At4g16230 isoform X1 [Elaeis guineensis]
MALVPVLLLALFFSLSVSGNAHPKVPAIYVFGDSTADVGNNNYLPDVGKANFLPYGIDFPHSRPTGRYTNGYNGIDFLARQMGLRMSPPPYLSLPKNTSNRVGVNYASGGSGILDSTQGNKTITMTKQIKYFATTNKSNIVLSKSIFLISAGANDVIAFVLNNTAPSNTQIERFCNTLISNYKNHIEALYNLGARKFGIIDVGPVGCCPFARRLFNHSGACFNVMNDLAVGVNDDVKKMLSNLSSTLKGMKYSLGSYYAALSNMIANPEAAGFKDVQSACCGGESLAGCTRTATYCENRNEYLLWDDIHPTQRAYEEAVLDIYSGSPPFVTPINFKQLVEE